MGQTLRETPTWHTAEVTMDFDAPGTADTTSVVECPRCGASVSQRFYGPCESCYSALRAQFPGVARDVAVGEYVPKMNVTPNAVAQKDD